MEYMYPNLPNYTRLTPISATSNAVVAAGAVLFGTEDGVTIWVKHPDGTYTSIGGGVEVTLGYISSGLFQPVQFYGKIAVNSGTAVSGLSCYTFNTPTAEHVSSQT